MPRRTPFVLQGSGTDPDANTVLSYTWEQIDPSPVQAALDKENRKGALFRSLLPSPTGYRRTFPNMTTALKMGAERTLFNSHERLSSVAAVCDSLYRRTMLVGAVGCLPLAIEGANIQPSGAESLRCSLMFLRIVSILNF